MSTMTPKQNLVRLGERASEKLKSHPVRDANGLRVTRLDFTAGAYESTCASGDLGTHWSVKDVTAFIGGGVRPRHTRLY